ncbi:MAG: UDP-N-acetylmuramoyl-tripeptide--D-alanyl-D-alanine ligase [Phycisphaerales bacterium]
MTFWTHESIRTAAGARWLAPPPERIENHPAGVSIDTRTLAAGQVFVALAGERVDGHAYLEHAREAGASMALVEREDAALPDGLPVAVAPDGREALTRLARAYRAASPNLRVVGVTGSNGKTTTVRLIHAVLSGSRRGSASQKSYNNALGLPLTILNAGPSDQYVVCEMGMSTPGEIAALGRIAQPDVGVITSIGRAHLEALGSVEAIAREKASILEHVRGGGVGIVPAGVEVLERAIERIGSPRLLRVGTDDAADVRVTHVKTGARGVAFELNGRAAFEVPLLGAHNAHNGAVAVAVGWRFGLDDDAIRAGLANARPVAGRLERVTLGPRGAQIKVLNDSYNANPDSMLAAIGTLCEMKPGTGGRRVAILGDMLELGDDRESAHAEIARAVAGARGIHAAVLVGDAMRGAAGEAGGKATPGELASDADADRIAAMVEPGDVVLIKASRGVRLERVAEALDRRFGARR